MKSALYENDFFAWSREQAELLRAGQLGQADIEHIAEEIHDMGVSQRKELQSRLEVLLQHLLKWQLQPGLRGSSWRDTIDVQRFEISESLDDMPSLRPVLATRLSKVYRGAVFKASKETKIPKASFPAYCPFTIEQILDEEFYPE